ncbi:MAG TPA: shikimate kinase [Candidatus Acidoferrales bacterium]|jgi:shikimate kinase|nr:shikimate kinase [Candidatus Acidoferrales bacterium]
MISENRPRKLICLTGFMGSGKSTAAGLLARQLGWQHIDLDKRITDATSLSIPEIFSRMGEPEFRRIEHEQLRRVVGESRESQKPRVVSLGGGTISQPLNLALLRETGAVLIWLQCPIEELLLRCATVTDRPLFRDETSFRTLYQQRLPAYESADYRVDSSAEPARVVEQILALGIFPRVVA